MPASPSPVNGPVIRTTSIEQLSNSASDDSTTTEPSTPVESTSPITENPFESPESKPLFEAIDQLQSCQINQHIEIPQVSRETYQIEALSISSFLSGHPSLPNSNGISISSWSSWATSHRENLLFSRVSQTSHSLWV